MVLPHVSNTSVIQACTLAASLWLWPTPGSQAQSLDEARALFEAGDSKSVEAGIQTLGMMGSADTLSLLIERIEAGLPPELLDTAILTLAAIGSVEAEPTLAKLSRHRRPRIRAAALSALSVTGGELAFQTLRHCLSDGETVVRRAAAAGLGELKRPEAMPRLLLALRKGNAAAAPSIGKLLPSSDIPSLLQRTAGTVPFHHISPALLALLRRKDVGDGLKLTIVRHVATLNTSEGRGFLNDVVATSSERLSQQVRSATLKASQEVGR